MKKLQLGLFFLILLIALLFRLYGINWDQNQHLDPDERFLTMVATAMQWPDSFSEYLDPQRSKLNPHNIGFDFYVYGTWPVILVKFIAEQLGKADYINLTLVGRAMSALTDIGTLILVFFITKRIQSQTSNVQRPNVAALLAMGIYAIMALPIQLSHFYTTDPYVTFALTATLFLLTFTPSLLTGILTGFVFALALSAKLSAAPFAVIIALAIGLHFIKNNKVDQIVVFILSFTVIFVCFFRVFMPYLFADSALIPTHLNPKVIGNINQLKSFNDPKAWFPPAVQWINTIPFVFPLIQIIFWGLGLPLAIVCFVALGWTITQIKKYPLLLLPLTVCLLIFGYQGFQFAKPMRYYYPLYPSLAVLTGIWVSVLLRKKIMMIPLLFTLIWPISFMAIYARPHSRIAASEWIYQNLPSRSVITKEHWDDGLPLNLPNTPNHPNLPNSLYTTLELPMYAPDDPAKWQEIQGMLDQAEYLILSSNRVYGSITSAPERFPQTIEFYQKLFANQTEFKKIAEFTSRPTLPLPINLCISLPFFHYGIIDQSRLPCSGVMFVDDYAEESWTVYDHPKVIIFQKQ